MSKPTKAQVRKVVAGMVLQGKTQTQAMLDAGYSKNYSTKKQKILRQTRLWEEILAEDFADSMLAKRQKSLMNHKIMVTKSFPITTPDNVIRNLFRKCKGKCEYIGDEVKETNAGIYHWRTAVGYVMDVDLLDKQVDRLYKLKGLYKNTDFSAKIDWNLTSEEDLDQMEKELDEEEALFSQRYEAYINSKTNKNKTRGIVRKKEKNSVREKEKEFKN